MNEVQLVSLAGLSVSVEFLKELYINLRELKIKSAIYFWECVHLARNPQYLLHSQRLKELFDAGVLGSENEMNYLNRIAILHLVEGQDRKVDLIRKDEFDKLISP